MSEAATGRIDTFIEGQVIRLRRPDIERDVLNGDWHHWFNDRTITQNLEHGVFPVTREEQAEIVRANMGRDSVLLLTVVDKKSDAAVGLVSLKDIDLINRRAEIVIVMGFERPRGGALEAWTLLTKHAFDRLNLLRIVAGHHETLWTWVNTIAVVGYRLEGYRRDYGLRDGKPYGVMLTGITAADFRRREAARGGNILGPDMDTVIAQRRAENPLPKLQKALAAFERGLGNAR